MANRSYLAVSNIDTIYPSFVQKDYNPSNQLIATDIESLPLLWLALFREGDLQTKVFNTEDGDVSAFAPVCSKEKAIQQLRQAIPHLVKIFPNLGPLEDYCALFCSAIESLPYQYVTIELQEISWLYSEEQHFTELLKMALRGFDCPDNLHLPSNKEKSILSKMQLYLEQMGREIIFVGEVDDEKLNNILFDPNKSEITDLADFDKISTTEEITVVTHTQILEQLTSLRASVQLPSVRMYLDNLPYSEDEQWNLTRVLGAGLYGSMGYGREVPWEKEDADYGWKITSLDSD
jgi:hypothetical protein